MRSFGRPALTAVPTKKDVEQGVTLPYRNIDSIQNSDGKISYSFPLFPGVKNLRSLFDQIVDYFNSYPIFGGLTENKAIEWLTYGEFGDLVHATVAGMLQNGVTTSDFFGVLLENTIYFPLAQWVSAYLGSVLVPIDYTYLPEVLIQIIKIFKCTVLICSANTFHKLTETYPRNPPDLITKIFVFCDDKEYSKLCSEFECSLEEKIGIPVFPLHQLIIPKVDHQQFELEPIESDRLCVLNTGTGRCGSLKPCYLTHENLIAAAAGIISCEYNFGRDIYLSTIPMFRVVERSMQLAVLAFGGCIAFLDLPLVQALSVLRPTIIMLTGDRMNELSGTLLTNAAESNCLTRAFYDFAFSLAAQAKEAFTPIPWIARTLAIDPNRQKVGGRLRLIISTGCYLEPRVQYTLRTMLQIPVVQMYGVTEAGGVVCIQKIYSKEVSVVGAPTTSNLIRIKDFFAGHTRVNDGDAGEIIVKGPNVFKCYHRNEDLTNRFLSDDGWFSTGDIGKILPDGSLEIIDTVRDFHRRKKGKR
ncbi:AMP-binding enzyme family protein [Tritrichomonas foetus]|uniref:AMP-binding enzyme family protein n=1 Tax=Tritrichomonas foetus TaxID=1144522 RepID=A0A1J4KDL9_9EUKA|nr:AMP-binding enzyme family protein [Tritrichomonas foetus]|eukprot:OHT09535.1 AMP-binding enzyme family protein [Tritrichomonas foetus]